MRTTYFSFWTLIFFLFLPMFVSNAQSQQNESANQKKQELPAETDTSEFANMELPPLSVLLEAAGNNPQTENLKSTKTMAEIDYKSIKREWLGKVGISGSYNYGVGASMGNGTTSSGTSVLNYSSTLSSSYGVGIGVGVPLSVFSDHKSKMKKQEELLKQIDNQLQQSINDNKLKIIELYTTASLNLNTLKSKSEVAVLANAMLQMKETDYVNGMINISELSSAKKEQADAFSEYQSSKAELTRAILLLELQTGVKIINHP